MAKIIGLSGGISSGKDTVADILVRDHGFSRLSFGAAVKDAVAPIFGWDRELLEGVSEASRAWREVEDKWWTEKLDFGISITPRWVLQNIGTQVMRKHFHEDIWIFAVENKLRKVTGDVVTTDTRFLNEINTIREYGGKTVAIWRKLPKWLNQWYVEIDGVIRRKTNTRYGLMDIDMTGRDARDMVMEIAERQLKVMGVELHESEWAFYLWNRYDDRIDNTGTLKHLTEQANRLAQA